MAYGSLFERLSGEASAREDLPRQEAIAASVMAHIGQMLSVRAGSVLMHPDYGLPDLNVGRFDQHHALLEVQASIRAMIERYEPRLSSVEVRTLGEGASSQLLGFCIEGHLNTEGRDNVLLLTARLNGLGRVEIEQGVICH